MTIFPQPLTPSFLGQLDPLTAVKRFREFLFCEARYIRLRPDAITISERIHVPDGGLDAEIHADVPLPEDSFFKSRQIGIQIKAGGSFKPWQKSELKGALFSDAGEVLPEVRRIIDSEGQYSLVCFGCDLTPPERNDCKNLIEELLAEAGLAVGSNQVDVLGQSQIAGYFDRYPSVRAALMGGSDGEFLTVDEWARHAHMQSEIISSEKQQEIVKHIRDQLLGSGKHIRILGEPGIGKTRSVLEAVRVEGIAPSVLYVEHGRRFGETALFRELLRSPWVFPLVLILDELSERELSDIWGHLKPRCGALKLVSIDHGPDRSGDSDIDRIRHPRLPDETIRSILESHTGPRRELDRWVSVCEGSPRVAQAVGENLAANPDDILRPPATVPLWERFLFGYAQHDSTEAAQLFRAMQYIALFSRFGYENPVSDEARYISALIAKADPAITWARFQEIIETLRERRVLQGSRTLFIVPWALHIYLWREFWRWHGNGFDFAEVFAEMPEALHGWFMEMFKYAHDTKARQVVKDILRPDGIFSNKEFLTSAKGASFLSTLAEADPEATLTLIESTIGKWSDEELLAFKSERQQIVWALEKIAVWRPTVLRAIRMLVRLALTENQNYSNNATGTLLGLFHIGPEWVATEASPAERMPALLELLRSANGEQQRLGLKVADAALATRGGIRVVGPENQGLKETVKMWRPVTYAEWGDEYLCYWKCLVSETREWPDDLRTAANSTILSAAEDQITVPPHATRILSDIEAISNDPATDRHQLNKFFSHSRRHLVRDKEESNLLALRRLEGKVTRRDLESRFHRYVIDVDWYELHEFDDDDERAPQSKRARKLMRALAARAAQSDKAFDKLLPLFETESPGSPALALFGEALCEHDSDFKRLEPLLSATKSSGHSQCLGGYFQILRKRDESRWVESMLQLLAEPDTASLGAELVWRTGFNELILDAWLRAFERYWIDSSSFRSLCYGGASKDVPTELMTRLLTLLSERDDQISLSVVIDLLDQVLKGEEWPISADFVFNAVTQAGLLNTKVDAMQLYDWHRVCQRLIAHDQGKALPLLDWLLQQMRGNYRLSYDREVEACAREACSIDAASAWPVVEDHLLSESPKCRGDVMHWLKGGLDSFNEKITSPPMALFPTDMIMNWIAEDPDNRAAMIAHCTSKSLDDKHGGALTRELLTKYSHVNGVIGGISASFHSGGWSGPTSNYLRRKRDMLRRWLGKGFEQGVVDWINREITGLDKQIECAEIEEEREPWNRPGDGT